MKPNNASVHAAAGFSLVELMVALALGLLLTVAMGSVYLSTKMAFGRQSQLSSIQQNVRTAFEYLSSDARMVGHMGCFTGSATTPNCAGGGYCNPLAATSIATNYAVGVEGYDYKNATAGQYTLTSSSPNNDTTATDWETNLASGGVNTVPISDIAGSGAGDGLTPGSDVLVIRTVSGPPVRLTADTAAAATTLNIENVSSGKCSDGTTDKVSGFCASTHGLIASCTNARVFSVSGAITAPTLTMAASLGGDPIYTTTGAEVFPLQTVVYYVKKSSSGSGTSLYRRTFNGDPAAGMEQELIEGVENLQFTYGRDTSVPPDGAIDGAYVAAKDVANWSTVVAVRMSVLLRATDAVGPNLDVAASAPVNGVLITYPGGTKYDRRVFTTTVAVRNKIAYF